MSTGFSSSQILKENAFTNNTFSLRESEKEIRSTLENSFNYLKGLQGSYIGFKNFIFTENDLYLDNNSNVCLSVNKDFIDLNKRKIYKNSAYYNKYNTLDEISGNEKYFSFFPIVLIDGKSIFSYKVKTSLDGFTNIQFTRITEPINYINTTHEINVLFFENMIYNHFTTDINVINTNNSGTEVVLDSTVTNKVYDPNKIVFFFIKETDDDQGSNLFTAKTDNNGNLVIEFDKPQWYDIIFNATSTVEIYTMYIDDIYSLGRKPIQTRIDNGRLSSTFVIDNADKNMPVPKENIIVLRYNKNTDECTLDSTVDIVHHYPNIYEIMSDNLSNDYEYEVYYLYRRIQIAFHYTNHFKYIHQFYMYKMNTTSLEDAINDLLYSTQDQYLQNFFFNTFDYEDADYVYNHGDFSTKNPYDFDYKVAKMREFIGYDPYTLERYGKRVSMPSESYYLEVRNINLAKRFRNDTSGETNDSSLMKTFDTPKYIFAFRNDSASALQLRFFLDGILITDYYQIHSNNMEYFYIDASIVNADSFIEIEKFNSYKFEREITFSSLSGSVDMEFPDSLEIIAPTLNDLFITDVNHVRVDRNSFRIYALIDDDIFDASDDVETLPPVDETYTTMTDDIHVDPITGELYMMIDDLYTNISDSEGNIELIDSGVEQPGSTTREDVRYMRIKKLKIRCTDQDLIGKKLIFTISKIPYLANVKMGSTSMARFELFNGKIPWRESKSFVRTFVNGRYVPMDFNIDTNDDGRTYFASLATINAGDIVTVDISPYSYECEYATDEVPADFIVDFNALLSKPFSLDYYDVYLNGRKLTPYNIQAITPMKVKLFNVSSRKNFYIFRKDRDVEYYGFKTRVDIPLDDIFGSSNFTDEDKNKIIEAIIRDTTPGIPHITPGTDTEVDVNGGIGDITQTDFDLSMFYYDIIIPEGITRANSFYMDGEKIRQKYNSVYQLYSNQISRLVIRPNTGHGASLVLKVGKYDSNVQI